MFSNRDKNLKIYIFSIYFILSYYYTKNKTMGQLVEKNYKLKKLEKKMLLMLSWSAYTCRL